MTRNGLNPRDNRPRVRGHGNILLNDYRTLTCSDGRAGEMAGRHPAAGAEAKGYKIIVDNDL